MRRRTAQLAGECPTLSRPPRRPAGEVPQLWGAKAAGWPAAVQVNLCATNVRGPLSPLMDSGNLRLFATVDPRRICGALPPPMHDPGTGAGVYLCRDWPWANSKRKVRQWQVPPCAPPKPPTAA